jgi:hypothetical protein
MVTDAQLVPYAHTLPEPPQPIEGPLMQVRLQNGLNLVPVQGESVPLPTDGADDGASSIQQAPVPVSPIVASAISAPLLGHLPPAPPGLPMPTEAAPVPAPVSGAVESILSSASTLIEHRNRALKSGPPGRPLLIPFPAATPPNLSKQDSKASTNHSPWRQTSSKDSEGGVKTTAGVPAPKKAAAPKNDAASATGSVSNSAKKVPTAAPRPVDPIPVLSTDDWPEEILHKNQVLFNTLSSYNVKEKAGHLSRWIASDEKYHEYFALYLVKKRVQNEQNNHRLYTQLIDAVNEPKLSQEVIKVTYEVVKQCLVNVDHALASTTHRAILKTLGNWLGSVTLARNKPLVSKKIDLKGLLFEAYESATLTAVLPLVCKIMEGVEPSKVYKMPNPWTTAVMVLLAEIHDLPGLRTNLMFEVEVLCNHLNIRLGELPRSRSLKGKVPLNSHDFSGKKRVQREEREQNLSAEPSSLDAAGATQTPADCSSVAALTPDEPRSERSGGLHHQHSSRFMDGGEKIDTASWNISHSEHATANPRQGNSMPHLSRLQQIPPPIYGTSRLANASHPDDQRHLLISSRTMSEFEREIWFIAKISRGQVDARIDPRTGATLDGTRRFANPNIVHEPSNSEHEKLLRTCVVEALKAAITEIAPSVVERTVTISCLTTRGVATKDFQRDPDPEVLLKSCRGMASTLASSLALVTAREPFRMAFSNHLRRHMEAISDIRCPPELRDELARENFIVNVTQDNVEIGAG